MRCQSSPTKFKGGYRKLTANERERGRIMRTLRILMGSVCVCVCVCVCGRGGGDAMVNFTLMS